MRYLSYRKKLISSVGIEVMGYKKLKNNVSDDNDNLKIGFVESVRGSVIICDEIHNAYSTEGNTYGDAIQVISNYLGENITIVYMSATPILYIQNTS